MAFQVAFSLSVDTSGTAFDDGRPRAEVARILRAAADAIEHVGGDEGPCRDVNGQGVGRWRLVGIGE